MATALANEKTAMATRPSLKSGAINLLPAWLDRVKFWMFGSSPTCQQAADTEVASAASASALRSDLSEVEVNKAGTGETRLEG